MSLLPPPRRLTDRCLACDAFAESICDAAGCGALMCARHARIAAKLLPTAPDDGRRLLEPGWWPQKEVPIVWKWQMRAELCAWHMERAREGVAA